jgi:uncharacterized heparinase superfamily protein
MSKDPRLKHAQIAVARDADGPKAFWRRLAHCSLDELSTRSRQEISKRKDAWAALLGVPARTPQLLEARSRHLARFFFDTTEVRLLAAELQRRFPEECQRKVREAEEICRGEFDLLGYEKISYGTKIDWQSDRVHRKVSPRRAWYKIRYLDFAEVGDSKIIWELNRHQHLVALAVAYRLTDDPKFSQELLNQWFDWQRANPYPIGINWTSSLEVAFRSISWLWVWHLLCGTADIRPGFREDLCRSLAIHGRHIETYLSTYFSPNTHLLGEAMALFFIGTLCPEIPAAPRWKERGWSIICREAQRQVRKDGMYFEQSTYYHVYALDMCLHARILAQRNEVLIPREFDLVLERMLEFLYGISQVGVVPRFGDDDGGRLFDPRRNLSKHLLDPLATGAALFGRSDWARAAGSLCPETIWLLGSQTAAGFERLLIGDRQVHSVASIESGIYVLAACETRCEQLVVDAGPQGQGHCGHGHADALSVHLSVAGQEWLTDPGTFSYVAGEETREAFRSTAAHNTLQVDGISQASPTGPFSWTDLPNVYTDFWKTGRTSAFFEAHHTGYARLPNPVIHRRYIFYLHSQFWLIRDVAEGEGTHALDLYWHLAPRIQCEVRTAHGFLFRAPDGTGLALRSTEGNHWLSKIVRGDYSAAYGRKESALVLRCSIKGEIPCGLTTLISSQDPKKQLLGRFVELTSPTRESAVYACAYEVSGMTHQWIFADGTSSWQFGELSSDARFLYCLFKRERLIQFILYGGSFLTVASQSLFTSSETVAMHEWLDASAELSSQA